MMRKGQMAWRKAAGRQAAGGGGTTGGRWKKDKWLGSTHARGLCRYHGWGRRQGEQAEGQAGGEASGGGGEGTGPRGWRTNLYIFYI